MARPNNDVGSMYSPAVGMVFVFNLIVGTGAITMPSAFHSAGWLLSIIIVICLAFTSYVTVTYVLECMACANAILLYNRRVRPEAESDKEQSDERVGVNTETLGRDSPSPEHLPVTPTENTRLITGPIADDYFRIRERVELGQMVSLFYNRVGVVIFYICLIVYLYGDLAIYAAAVPKSLRDVICVFRPNNSTLSNSTLSDDLQCFPGVSSLSRMDVYRLAVVLFAILLGPFVFFNVQKTTALQITTSVLRWLAFSSMIGLAIKQLSTHGPVPVPAIELGQLPNLFGVCVYSFMCHHSLPSLVTPIRKKSKLRLLMAADYGLILLFYVLLCMTAIFAFPKIPDLYTLTFEPTPGSTVENPAPKFFQYFLALFPVFTLSTSFPIIGITLRNNLKSLILKEGRKYPFLVDRILFPLLVLLPPVAVAIGTNDLEMLVGVTGAYAGAAIQYFVPITLLYCARKTVFQTFGGQSEHSLRSPFGHLAWLIILGVWAMSAVGFVTYKNISRL